MSTLLAITWMSGSVQPAGTDPGRIAATLHAIADPAVQPEDPAVTALDVPHVVDDPAQALQLPDLHAVVIATPTSTHPEIVVAEIVVAAAQAGTSR